MDPEKQLLKDAMPKFELKKAVPPPGGFPPLPEQISDEEAARQARKKWAREEDEKEKIRMAEKELASLYSKFPKLDDGLFLEEEEKKIYIEKIKNLSPEEKVYLYHGLNSGGYDGALEILNSPTKGVEQRSGPALSLVPVGQFWKGVGFRYALKREQIAFPGEENPQAIVKISGEDGLEDVGYIENETRSLPLDKFEAEVLRSKFADPNPEAEEKLLEKLKQFCEMREKKTG